MEINEKVKELILQQTSIDVDDKTRTREQVEARSLYYMLIKELTPKTTLKQIGKSVGKNHATVIHSLNQWDMFSKYNPSLNTYKERILKMFDKEIDLTDIDLLRKQINRLQGELIDLQIENEKLKKQLLRDEHETIQNIKLLFHRFEGTEHHELFLFRLNQLVDINSKRKI
jgi:predicted alpha/beta superfamily hydrolase